VSTDSLHAITINGTEYQIARFPATKGYELRMRIGKAIAPALGVASMAKDKAGTATDTDGLIDETIAKAIESLCRTWDVPEAMSLVKDLMGVVIIGANRASDVFDVHFAGRLGDVDRLCLEVVKHNGFFDGIESLVGRLNL
jgi:hypothetical protein